jgi:monoamine oxidase
VPTGYGTLIAASLPAQAALRLSTPVEAIGLDRRGVTLETPAGTVLACAAIVTVSTTVLARDAISWPSRLDCWPEAARRLPLGSNEKLFFEIVGDGPCSAPLSTALVELSGRVRNAHQLGRERTQ